MRTMLVGFGRIGNTISNDVMIARRFTYASHASVLAYHPRFDWQGVVDPDSDARLSAHMDWKVPHVGANLPDIVHEVRPEFAVLAIPPEYRIDAIGQMPDLKAVLIEKPMGRDGQKFLDICADRGIRAYVNFWRRGVPQLQELTEGRLETLIGKPQAVFATYGNGLYNNGSHLVDFIHMLLGDVHSVHTLSCDPISVVGCSGAAKDYHASFALNMGDYHIHVSPIDFNHYREVSLDIWGTKGRYSLFRETLAEFYYSVRDHRAMENQKELDANIPSTKPIDVSKSFYNIYSMIADDTLPRASLVTQEVLDAVVDS